MGHRQEIHLESTEIGRHFVMCGEENDVYSDPVCLVLCTHKTGPGITFSFLLLDEQTVNTPLSTLQVCKHSMFVKKTLGGRQTIFTK